MGDKLQFFGLLTIIITILAGIPQHGCYRKNNLLLHRQEMVAEVAAVVVMVVVEVAVVPVAAKVTSVLVEVAAGGMAIITIVATITARVIPP
jgi:hypothetical protein